jgi:hypothetical protein
MLRKTILATSLLAALVGMASAADQGSKNAVDSRVEDLTIQGEPPMLGIHWSRELAGSPPGRAAAARGGPKQNPNMSYHGGKILSGVVSQAIFWGPSWGSYVGDKITGVDAWYSGHNLSHYAATVNEYTGTNGQVQSNTLVHNGHIIDTSAASGGSKTSVILAEVCQRVSPDTSGNGYYPVYSDVKRGNAGYCAWHSYGACGGVPVQFAFFFNLDGDPGCDPQDTQTGHSQGLAALANVTGHEISEARSDPASPGAWCDASGAENGDKCAWTFHVPYVTFPDGNLWKLQGEWSNAAYSAGTGYANSSGQKGCADGS